MTPEQSRLERRKKGFELSALMSVRDKTLRAVRGIAERVEVGMYEEDAYEMSLAVLKDMGAEKNWHRPWIRFGPNTLKPYQALSRPRTRLGADDIFFIDIGPVWDGYEGDGGDTFVTGSDPELRRCKDDARRIFDEVSGLWRDKGLTGRGLYEHAVRRTQELGWEMNLRAEGHRVSDFPHAVYYKGGLADQPFSPSPHAWILEIQIRHPEKSFGAFYEDLLF